jgi:uncharacterized protein DUF4337
MEEMEDPTESLREQIEEVEEKREKWTLYVALTTAIIAVLAAIAGMYGNHHANEAMLDQMKATDQWAYYQAKSIKADMLVNSMELDSLLGKEVPAGDLARKSKYEKDKEDISDKAKELESGSQKHMETHVVFSRAVTIFQIAIAISAIAIVTRKKFMWYLSILLAVAGSVFLVLGFLAQ